MTLYERFLVIDPKKTRKVVNYLIDNCSTCKNVLLIYVALSPVGNYQYSEDEFLKAKNKISLDELYDGIKHSDLINNCNGCELCKINVFREKRQEIKQLVQKLKKLNTNYALLSLNKILSESIDIFIHLKKSENENCIYEYEFKNLYQKIIFSIVEEYKKKLNSSIYLKDYFIQIAKILVSTEEFIIDIKNIRDNFMEWKGTFYHRKDNTPYDIIGTDFEKNPHIFTEYVSSSEKFKNLHEVIDSEIEKLREKYKLSPRWRGWLYNMLSMDFENDKSVIYNSIPDGSVISDFKLIKNSEGENILMKIPVIVGDETKKNKEDFEIKNNQIIDFKILNIRRKPISEFEKQLRWYRLKENDESYINIFDYDLKNHFEDWLEFKEYKERRNEPSALIAGHELSYFERMAINRIKSGIKKIKDRIYKVYK